ncbi:MAG: 2-hydroxychromene-2-carboxylate isomerase [Burkholderiaceae bacterium]
MTPPIEFYFDFSSPYAYLASEQIEAIAQRHGRELKCKPILLGAIFKSTGGAPLTEGFGPKAAYSMHDFARSARFAGVRFEFPSPFPVATVTAARALLWLQAHQPEAASGFLHAVFRAYFVDGRDISRSEVVAQIAAERGLDAERVIAGSQDPLIKDELKAQVETAIVRGVFGAPFLFVGDEAFWGNDRLPQLDRWLAGGGF